MAKPLQLVARVVTPLEGDTPKQRETVYGTSGTLYVQGQFVSATFFIIILFQIHSHLGTWIVLK